MSEENKVENGVEEGDVTMPVGTTGGLLQRRTPRTRMKKRTRKVSFCETTQIIFADGLGMSTAVLRPSSISPPDAVAAVAQKVMDKVVDKVVDKVTDMEGGEGGEGGEGTGEEVGGWQSDDGPVNIRAGDDKRGGGGGGGRRSGRGRGRVVEEERRDWPQDDGQQDGEALPLRPSFAGEDYDQLPDPDKMGSAIFRRERDISNQGGRWEAGAGNDNSTEGFQFRREPLTTMTNGTQTAVSRQSPIFPPDLYGFADGRRRRSLRLSAGADWTTSRSPASQLAADDNSASSEFFRRQSDGSARQGADSVCAYYVLLLMGVDYGRVLMGVDDYVLPSSSE
ncbi:hypothetical protein CBR_g51960 [Chara braunii]|uniref:Uncharacterized protein n=1 Tax=Chara braunii TaxID=69332 RepID=A0A388K6H9_CHABU|nr:hypothetical protein CBR_g51960 [Chara braunii]|eukprot:GBG65660.1 hypothetical protein CBR_g51960 [Chara braunii]